MRRRDDLALIAFVVIMGGAVALAIAGDVTAPLCQAAELKRDAPDKIFFGCLEFWINRYQSLIGNVLTALVAGATLVWVAKQLVAANQQAAVASAQGLRLYAEDLEKEVRAYIDGRAEIRKCIPEFKRSIHAPKGWVRTQAQFYKNLDAAIFETQRTTNRFEVQHNSPPFTKTTLAIQRETDNARVSLNFLIDLVEMQPGLPDEFKIENYRAIQEAMKKADAAVENVILEVDGVITKIYAELRIIWTKIREFEQICKRQQENH